MAYIRLAVLLLMVPALLAPAARPAAGEEIDGPAARSVILLVPDGCDQSVATVARWLRDGEPLALDPIARGFVKTAMANSVVTDSAAAATAFATGVKTCVTNEGKAFLGVGPLPGDGRPYATVLEGARLLGKATGLVATSEVGHATPAAFAVHVPDRGDRHAIYEQLVHAKLDVVFGGGRAFLRGAARRDGQHLGAVLADRGYRLVRTAREMESLRKGPVWGLFAEQQMAPERDRPHVAPTEPSLAEMTGKAIELLSADPDGFFLLVEGSQVDWGHHANDPIHSVYDFLAFDDAVRVALDFAREDG
jgi:alkaline phosphatase